MVRERVGTSQGAEAGICGSVQKETGSAWVGKGSRGSRWVLMNNEVIFGLIFPLAAMSPGDMVWTGLWPEFHNA